MTAPTPEYDPHVPSADQNIRLAVAIALIEQRHGDPDVIEDVLAISEAVIRGRQTAPSPDQVVTMESGNQVVIRMGDWVRTYEVQTASFWAKQGEVTFRLVEQ